MKTARYDLIIDESRRACLVKEAELDLDLEDCITSPDNAVLLMEKSFSLSKRAEEHLFLICMDNAAHVIGVFLVSKGTSGVCIATPREIMIRALLCNASRIILLHNHPSGLIAPSKDDIETTELIKKASNIINISLMDFIVVGRNSDGVCYTSFKASEII